ncbi:MAG TPA: thioesterase family protein [Ferruginibacter sp.]|nr:thioesterase family protein [Ferruginibacter sp.]HMP22136.1 thioesterase family protein [Ferruginibacter sp.]
MFTAKIEIPATNALAQIIIPVRISDINYGNHVGNDAFVSLIHEARVQWLAANNYSELDAGGAGMIMSSLAIEFKKEAFYGDTIQVELYAGAINGARFEIYYRMQALRQGNPVIIALAFTGMVSFDYARKRPVPVSSKLMQLLKGEQ